MKSIVIALLALGVALPGASIAQVRGDCTATSTRGRCKAPPAPPAPPPLPHMADMSMPTPPMPPTPPSPPPPPPAPEVPESAHAACANKQVGARLTLTPRKGVTMTGTCQRDSQGMYFDLEQLKENQ